MQGAIDAPHEVLVARRLGFPGAVIGATGLHGVSLLNRAGSVLESHIGGQQLQTFDPSARQEKGGEMECVEGAKGRARHHVRGQIADRCAQLPQIAARPKRIQIALCVRETLLGRTSLLADPQQRTGRFHEGKSGSDEHAPQ